MIGLAALAVSLVGLDQHHKSGLFGYLMDYQIVATGDMGSVMDQDVVIASTVVQWDKMREKLGIDEVKNRKLTELHGPLGAMDWTREQVVFARAPELPSGGYTLSMLRLTKEAREGWKIELIAKPPKKDTMVVQMITRPYLVFRMRKVDGRPKLLVQVPKPH